MNEKAALFGETSKFRGSRKHSQQVVFSRHIGKLAGASAAATGVGSCGDSVTVYLKVERDRIAAIKCDPDGCFFTEACSDAVGKLAEGRLLEEALEIQPEDIEKITGELPEDHLHCARLAVNALGEAIAEYYRQTSGNKN